MKMTVDINNYPAYNPTVQQLEQAVNADPEILNKYAQKTDVEAGLDRKQDRLTAGEHISIIDNVISADGVDGETLNQIDTNKNDIVRQQREINALIKLQGGQIYDFEKVNGVAHELIIPKGARGFDILELQDVVSITHQSKNIADGDIILGSVTGATKVDGEYWKLNTATLYQRYGNKTYISNPSPEYDLSNGLTISFYARKDLASTVTNVRLTTGIELTDDSKDWEQTRLNEEWARIVKIVSPRNAVGKLAFSYGSNATINVKDFQVEQAVFVSDYYPQFEKTYNVEGFEGIKVDTNDKIIFNNSDGTDNPVDYSVEYAVVLKEVARYE